MELSSKESRDQGSLEPQKSCLHLVGTEYTHKVDLSQNVQCTPTRKVTQNKHVVSDGDRRSLGLLDLPREIILLILHHLPSSSLHACLCVHPALEALILDPHFMDAHTRHVLGLSDINDKDVGYNTLPKSVSPMMELWFLTHNTAQSSRDHNQTRIFMNRQSLFFVLNCFQHSLITWLAQCATRISDCTCDYEGNTLMGASKKDITSYINDVLHNSVSNLPSFIVRPLTKLALAFPELIEKTILTIHHALHAGKPTALQNVWFECIPTEVRNGLEPAYCLEIICGHTLESSALQSAMLIFFRADKWALWTGALSQFPGCRCKETWAFVTMNPQSSVRTIEQTCRAALDEMFERTVPNQTLNGQWKRQQLYPGLCHLLNLTLKDALINAIEEKCNGISVGIFEDKYENLCQQDFCLRHQLHHCCKDNDQRHSDSFVQHSVYVENKGTHACPEIRNFQEMSSCRYHGTNTCNVNVNMDPISHEDKHSDTQPSSRRRLTLHLDALFHQDILRYLCDFDCHQVLCPVCRKSWFPSKESLDECISRITFLGVVPYHLWPNHLLSSALSVLI